MSCFIDGDIDNDLFDKCARLDVTYGIMISIIEQGFVQYDES